MISYVVCFYCFSHLELGTSKVDWVPMCIPGQGIPGSIQWPSGHYTCSQGCHLAQLTPASLEVHRIFLLLPSTQIFPCGPQHLTSWMVSPAHIGLYFIPSKHRLCHSHLWCPASSKEGLRGSAIDVETHGRAFDLTSPAGFVILGFGKSGTSKCV